MIRVFKIERSCSQAWTQLHCVFVFIARALNVLSAGASLGALGKTALNFHILLLNKVSERFRKAVCNF